LLLGEGMVDRFRQEAITVANLQHANIVAVHGVRTVGDLHLFVMQYIPGRSLDRILRDEGRLSLQAVKTIVYHVGSALDYAHRRGVVHRDIKPGNILLDGDGDPVVTDFGIAKVAETTGYTRVGTVVGTPTYMSPEQCMGHDVGPASDQYALGIVAYEMLTGQPPFSGTGMAMMLAHTEQTPPSVRASYPEVPEPIDAAIMRMLAKKPEDRFPDLAAAVLAFDAHPLGALGPVRSEMSALAAAATEEAHLAEIVRLPRSPVPAGAVPSPAPAWEPGPPTDRREVVAIRAEKPADTIEVGECVVLAATPRSASDTRVDGVRLRWESSDPAVATVDAAGVLTGHAPGTATITVTGGSARTTLDVVVVGATVATIDVTSPTEVRAGARAALSARALDRRGAAVDAPITWTSRNPSIATITDSGALTAVRHGAAVVVAAAGGVARAVTITITPPPVVDIAIDGMPPALVVGASATLRAVVRSARSQSTDLVRTLEWRSSDPSVAMVSGDGTVTARSPGQAVITATCDAIQGSSTLTVVSVRAATVVLAAPAAPLRLGDRLVLKATVYDDAGKVVNRPVAWRSTDARVAPVDQSGQVVAQAEGWAIVTATSDGISAHAEIFVRQRVVPESADGRRELRRLSLRWWVLLAVIAGAVALGWQVLWR
jgi:serine/threonine-protein kinase